MENWELSQALAVILMENWEVSQALTKMLMEHWKIFYKSGQSILGLGRNAHWYFQNPPLID